jgi:hypothetical protein
VYLIIPLISWVYDISHYIHYIQRISQCQFVKSYMSPWLMHLWLMGLVGHPHIIATQHPMIYHQIPTRILLCTTDISWFILSPSYILGYISIYIQWYPKYWCLNHLKSSNITVFEVGRWVIPMLSSRPRSRWDNLPGRLPGWGPLHCSLRCRCMGFTPNMGI